MLHVFTAVSWCLSLHPAASKLHGSLYSHHIGCNPPSTYMIWNVSFPHVFNSVLFSSSCFLRFRCHPQPSNKPQDYGTAYQWLSRKPQDEVMWSGCSSRPDISGERAPHFFQTGTLNCSSSSHVLTFKSGRCNHSHPSWILSACLWLRQGHW